MQKDPTYDARYSDMHEEGEYNDLLVPFDFYDEFQSDISRKLSEYIERYCKDKKIIKVLEAGSGTGVTTRKLLNTDPRVDVVAVDNEKVMVDIANTNFSKESDLEGRVRFIYSDILNSLEGLEDNSFDVFASVYTLHNFTPDYRRKAINLISKKIKPGGIFINGDKYAREGNDHKIDFTAEIKSHDKFDIMIDAAEKKGDIKKVVSVKLCPPSN